VKKKKINKRNKGETVISLTRVKMLAIGAVLLLLASCASKKTQTDDLEWPANDITASSVTVTNLKANHGGSGTIMRSTQHESLVLTNAHVCGVVEKGGLVSGRAGTFMVAGYKKSNNHDLCMIRVEGNLKYNTTVAKHAPAEFYEDAAISGHPALYPTVRTYGHFSGFQQVPIMMGSKPCTAEDMESPEKAFVCALAGGLPIIKTFHTQLVTATIMPGSSGSGVYNENLELSGVVFAGQGELGYALIVPYASVKNFIIKEQFTLEYTRPDNTMDLFEGSGQSKVHSNDIMEKLHSACSSSDRIKIKNLCEIVESDMVK
jgi:hypothetical protein